MASFAVVIGYQLENQPYKSIVLDTVDEPQLTSSARITEQPLVNGDIVADHMFNEPKTMTISGVLSMNGSKVTVIDGQHSLLANFQELFEQIQSTGTKCDIVKISAYSEEDIRFLHRQNMVIQSISWTEHINSLSYTLSFREVITAEVISYDIDPDDNFLPDITEPETLSFTETLFDVNAVVESVVKILLDNKLMDKLFLQSLTSERISAVVGGIALASGALIAAIAGLVGAGPGGWAVLAAGLLLGGLVLLVKAFVGWISKLFKKNKYKIKPFKWTESDKKNQKEIKRFLTFIDKIVVKLEELNNVMHVYRVSADKPQECMISVGDEYYIFTYTRNNVSDNYSLKVDSITMPQVGSMTDISTSPTDLSQLNNSNCLVKASNNASIYSVYLPVANNDESIATATPNKNDLRNYVILVSDINIEEYNKLIEDVIKNEIFK